MWVLELPAPSTQHIHGPECLTSNCGVHNRMSVCGSQLSNGERCSRWPKPRLIVSTVLFCCIRHTSWMTKMFEHDWCFLKFFSVFFLICLDIRQFLYLNRNYFHFKYLCSKQLKMYDTYSYMLCLKQIKNNFIKINMLRIANQAVFSVSNM